MSKIVKEDCIFIDKPPYCSVCLNSHKLQCLVDHQHLEVSPAGKKELLGLLTENIDSGDRYKTKSGEEQRAVPPPITER